jgi:putative glutamine amidotransferase
LRPLIAITTWRRELPTFLDPRNLLYTLGDEYVRSVAAPGAIPLLLPHLGPSEVPRVLDGVDGLVISGGGDVHPASYGAEPAGSDDVDGAADASEIALVRQARDRGLPTLAICRGMQVVNVAFGGTLRQEIGVAGTVHPPVPHDDPELVRRMTHPVSIVPGSRLATVLGAGRRSVNTIHHQGVEDLGEGLEVVATAPDGMIEAIEPRDPTWPVLAVQWHPEKLAGADAPLFDWLAAVAAGEPWAAGVIGSRA